MSAVPLLARIGGSGRFPVGSVWLVGSAEQIDAAYVSVDSALQRRGDETLVILVEGPDLHVVRRRLPHETVVACPRGSILERWVARARPRLLIRLGDGRASTAASFGLLRVQNPDGLVEDDILAALPPSPALAKPPHRGPHRGPHPLAEPLVRLAAGPPIATLSTLKQRLGSPSAILCLGNGPSSEDPDIAGFGAASLFRVNWIWRERGRMVRPDLVFTADPDLPGRGHRPILAFPRRQEGWSIAARHVLRGRRPSTGYMFCDEIAPTAAEIGRDLIPTNGALMIAMAAALQPLRLGIAGVDLYRHPAGRYPGDKEAVDGYARQHRIELDLDLIRRSLAGFGGEIVLFGAALKQALGNGE